MSSAILSLDVRGPRFAAAPVVGAVATGLALVAALLNAVTGFCLGVRAAPGRPAGPAGPHLNPSINGGTRP